MNSFAKLSVAVKKPVVRWVPKPTPVTYIGIGQRKVIGRLLQDMGCKKAFLMLSGTVYRSGILDDLIFDVQQRGIECEIYTGVTPDPTFAGVAEATKKAFGCDVIVAVGGGSVLDTAKTVSAAATDSRPPQRLAGILKVRKTPLPWIAVPTTAGTGSETTLAAVVSDTETHQKKQLLDPRLVPGTAVLDPQLTAALPAAITAFTGFDALTHALEAAVSQYATKETDRWAAMATRMIFSDLPKILAEPENLALRQSLLEASFYAGMAFTRVYVGYVHAFAHSIGGRYGVSHGLANAVLLPYVMEYYLPVCQKQFALLAQAVGCTHDDMSEKEKAETFVKNIALLAKACGVPQRLEKFKQEGIEDVITDAFKECHGNYPVPRYFDKSTARKLLLKVCAVSDQPSAP